VNIIDCYKDSRFNPAVDKKSGYRTRSMLCAPIREPRSTTKARAAVTQKDLLQAIGKERRIGGSGSFDETTLGDSTNSPDELRGGKIVAVLQLINKSDAEMEARGEYAHFTEEDEQLLLQVTQELGMALQKRDLYMEVLRSTAFTTNSTSTQETPTSSLSVPLKMRVLSVMFIKCCFS
jgi:hypothetical protein